MSTIAVAIKTIPDLDTGRRLYDINNLADEGVAKAMFHLQQQRTGEETLPHYLQHIIAIAIAREYDGKIQTIILGDESSDESSLLQAYIDLVDNEENVVTWGGEQFTFPVLGYRALKHKLRLPKTTQTVDLSQQFDKTAHAEPPSLSDISCLLELPSYTVMNKRDIWKAWLNKDFAAIKSNVQASAENQYRIFKAL